MAVLAGLGILSLRIGAAVPCRENKQNMKSAANIHDPVSELIEENSPKLKLIRKRTQSGMKKRNTKVLNGKKSFHS